MSVQKPNSQSKSTSSLNDDMAQKTQLPLIKDLDRVKTRLFKDLMTPNHNALSSVTTGLKKDLSKAYFALSQETTETIMHPQENGKWGYLKRPNPNTSTKLFRAANIPDSKTVGAVVTCSQEEYMTLWLKNTQEKNNATTNDSLVNHFPLLPILDASQGIPTVSSNKSKRTQDAIANANDSKKHRHRHKRHHHHHHHSKNSKEKSVELGVDGIPAAEHKRRHRSGHRRPKSSRKSQSLEREILIEKLIPAMIAEHKKNAIIEDPVIAPPMEPITARKEPLVQIPYKMQETLPDGIQGQSLKIQEETPSSLPMRNDPVTSPDRKTSSKSPQATQLDMSPKLSVTDKKDTIRSSSSQLTVPNESEALLNVSQRLSAKKSSPEQSKFIAEQDSSALFISNGDLTVPVAARRLIQGLPVKPSASRRVSLAKVPTLMPGTRRTSLSQSSPSARRSSLSQSPLPIIVGGPPVLTPEAPITESKESLSPEPKTRRPSVPATTPVPGASVGPTRRQSIANELQNPNRRRSSVAQANETVGASLQRSSFVGQQGAQQSKLTPSQKLRNMIIANRKSLAVGPQDGSLSSTPSGLDSLGVSAGSAEVSASGDALNVSQSKMSLDGVVTNVRQKAIVNLFKRQLLSKSGKANLSDSFNSNIGNPEANVETGLATRFLRRASTMGNDKLKRSMPRKSGNRRGSLRSGGLNDLPDTEIDYQREEVEVSLIESSIKEAEEIKIIVPPRHIHDSHRARVRWLLFLYAALRNNRIQLAKPITPRNTPATASPSDFPEQDLIIPYLTPYDRESMSGAIKIHEIYKIHPSARDESHFATLDRLFSGTRFFSKFPQSLRIKLYNECTLATFPRGKLLIREGKMAEFCYILLIGECVTYNQSSLSQFNPTVISTTEMGGCMGEFMSLLPSEQRTYSVSCVMRTTVLYMAKADWARIAREAKAHESYQLDVLSSMSLFKRLPKADLTKLSTKGIIQKYEPGATILNVEEFPEYHYFIAKGKVKIYHRLIFIKTPDETLDRRFKARQKYDLKDEIVDELEPVSDLSPGHFFPPLHRPSTSTVVLAESIRVALGHAQPEPTPSATPVQSSSLNTPIDTPQPVSPIIQTPATSLDHFPSPFTFVASPDSTAPVEIFCIAKKHLMEVIPIEMMTSLLTPTFFPEKDSLYTAQERYLVIHGWRGGSDVFRVSERIARELERRGVTYENFRIASLKARRR